ncbi:hypothetical protein [Cytobacillus oceanisediminis]|jgi:hypothetical protein|nr:hypothetical protein [Cytobacillus oceanisediminis]
MELLMEQVDHDQSEEPCEEWTPKTEGEENFDTSDYDYHKRLWF